jgi:hypothetical protein
VTREPHAFDFHACTFTNRHREHRKRNRNPFAADHYFVEVAVVGVVVVVALALESKLVKEQLRKDSSVAFRRRTKAPPDQCFGAEAVEAAPHGMLIDQRIGFLCNEDGDVLDPYVGTLQHRHQGISARHDSSLALQ